MTFEALGRNHDESERDLPPPSRRFVLIRQSDSLCQFQFWVDCATPAEGTRGGRSGAAPRETAPRLPSSVLWPGVIGERGSRRFSGRSGGGPRGNPEDRPRATLTTNRDRAPPAYRLSRLGRAQPPEPILLPKVRIQLADFPYLHCSNRLEAVDLGDLLRTWVRSGANVVLSPGFSRDDRRRTGHRGSRGALSVLRIPYLRLSRFHGKGTLRRKENSSPGPPPPSPGSKRESPRLGPPKETRLSPPGSGILTRFPFGRGRGGCVDEPRPAALRSG